MGPCTTRGTSRAGKGGITDATDFAAASPACFAPRRSGRPRTRPVWRVRVRAPGVMTNGGVRYAEVEQAGRWRQDLLRPDRGSNPLERIAALRAAHPGDLGGRPPPEATEFPRWPLLRLNTERV